MRIVRTFEWHDGRAHDQDEILAPEVAHSVSYGGGWFELQSWKVRFVPGELPVTEALYNQVGTRQE